MLSKLKIPAIIVAVIVVECGVACLLLPPAAEPAALTEPVLEADIDLLPPEVDENKKEPIEQGEIDLGKFSITSYHSTKNTTLRIDCHLYGIINVSDLEEFATLLERNHNRFRDQVIVIIRSAEIEDISDAGLGLLKRKILEETNRTLGKPFLKSVIFSDFSFIEQ